MKENRIGPSYVKKLGSARKIDAGTTLIHANRILEELFYRNFGSVKQDSEQAVQEFYEKIIFYPEIPDTIKELVFETFGVRPDMNKESHVLLAKERTIEIFANDVRGHIYGLVSLIQLSTKGDLPQVMAYDIPLVSERGLKVFLPGAKNIPYFKSLVDMLLLYKFNTIMIEIGGAMEYKSHPEINEGWVEYCRDMAEYSGKTKEIQEFTYPWYKNAIHMENGDGGFLTQDEVKEIVRYCEERRIEIIPEVPSLGHCDYLLLGNKDIAEIPEDPYPDTYCPSNPRSYEILFDVLDEVVEVFAPKRINIGHDEYYSIGICEKCRGKSGEEIFAEDVRKIHGFLKERGVKTIIWGDKILKDVYVKDAGPFGGEEMIMYFPSFRQKDGKVIGKIPATHKSIDMIPGDVEILHWLWSLGEDLEDQIFARRFKLTYGNFEGYFFPNWKEHIKKGGEGAMISNWSTLNETILQRNGIFFGIAYAYEMFWNPDFEDEDFEKFRDKALHGLFYLKYPEIEKYRRSETLVAHPCFVDLLYHTDMEVEFKFFVDGVFPEMEVYRIGEFVFRYANQKEIVKPIVLGENIGSRSVKWERSKKENPERGESIYKLDDRLIEMAMNTLPMRIHGETFYRYPVENPHPEWDLVHFEIRTTKECGIKVHSLNYCF